MKAKTEEDRILDARESAFMWGATALATVLVVLGVIGAQYDKPWCTMDLAEVPRGMELFALAVCALGYKGSRWFGVNRFDPKRKKK